MILPKYDDGNVKTSIKIVLENGFEISGPISVDQLDEMFLDPVTKLPTEPNETDPVLIPVPPSRVVSYALRGVRTYDE